MRTEIIRDWASLGQLEGEWNTLHDLLCWRDARVEILYWRTAPGEEVDFVVEVGRQLLPIEVKATPRPRLVDAAPLRAFRAEYGKVARTGLLLHTGTALEWVALDVLGRTVVAGVLRSPPRRDRACHTGVRRCRSRRIGTHHRHRGAPRRDVHARGRRAAARRGGPHHPSECGCLENIAVKGHRSGR